MTAVEEGDATTLGLLLRSTRQAGGWPVTTTAHRAGISTRHLLRLEQGQRRTRQSTLTRLAQALTSHPDSAAQLLSRLLDTAGIALAPESPYSDKINRRRGRRQRKQART